MIFHGLRVRQKATIDKVPGKLSLLPLPSAKRLGIFQPGHPSNRGRSLTSAPTLLKMCNDIKLL